MLRFGLPQEAGKRPETSDGPRAKREGCSGAAGASWCARQERWAAGRRARDLQRSANGSEQAGKFAQLWQSQQLAQWQSEAPTSGQRCRSPQPTYGPNYLPPRDQASDMASPSADSSPQVDVTHAVQSLQVAAQSARAL